MADILNAHAPLVTVFSTPGENSEPVNTLLYGEQVRLLERVGNWVKIQSIHDGYEGYVRKSMLSEHFEKPHKVCVPVTNLYNAPDFKTEPRHPLYFGSPVSSLQNRENGFIQLGNEGWVFEEHLIPAMQSLPDFVQTAMLFLHAPYVWGGRSMAGIDCSGLVQIALMAAGIACPRDTAQQIEHVGRALEFGDTIQYAPQLESGDLVFFERHVGIMIDGHTILNATSRHMRVVLEPLADMAESYDGILAVRRI